MLSGDLDAARDSTTLQHFLSDEESIAILGKPLAPFNRASQGHDSTRSKFEAKTAPIHVSQSANGEYDLEQIKTDALWLSEELGLDEVLCLRIAILEWQQRAADQLFAESEQNAVKPAVDMRASFVASTASFSNSTNGTAGPALDFSKEDMRRERLLRIYTEERTYSLKIVADLVSYCASQGQADLRRSSSWLDELAVEVVQTLCAPTLEFQQSQKAIVDCIDWIDKTFQKLNDRTKWHKIFDKPEKPDREELYLSATLTDVNSMLRIVLAQVYSLEGPPGGHPVLRWFNIMKKEHYHHLQWLAPTALLKDVTHIQCLASAISLVLLSPEESIHLVCERAEAAHMEATAGAAYPNLSGVAAYITEDATVTELHKLILSAAAEGYDFALPAVYAWSLIIKCIRDIAVPLSMARQQDSIEEGSSDTEAGSRRPAPQGQETQLEKQWELLQQNIPPGLPSEARTDPAVFLLENVVESVYAAMPILSATLSTAYTSGENSLDQTSLLAREALVELVKEGFDVVPYSDEVCEAMFALLRPSINGVSPSEQVDALPNTLGLNGNGQQPHLLEQALIRYPYELSPLLRLVTLAAHADSSHPAGSHDTVQLLETLQAVTVMVPHHFRSFRLENEEENVGEMVLTDTLSLFQPRQQPSFEGEQRLLMNRAMQGHEAGEGNVMLLPAGTSGTILKEDRPIVLRLTHKHSGLEFLGLLLSTLLPTSELIPATPVLAELDRATASEILSLINALLSAALRRHQGVEEAKFVLGRLSYALTNEQDVITIISDIFEMELLSYLAQAAQPGSLDLLVACAEFLDILVDISPERVWALLNRSSLLGGNSGGPSAMAAVVGGTEVQTGSFRFLAACTRLSSHLVDDAIAGLVLVKRKPVDDTAQTKTRGRKRFDSPFSEQLSATPERTIKDVVTAWQRIMLDAFQNFASWRFAVIEEKQGIAESMMATFESIVRVVYGLELPPKRPRSPDSVGKEPARERLAALAKPAADMIIQAFAPAAGASALLDGFNSVMLEGLVFTDDLVPTAQRQKVQRQVKACCKCVARILRTTRASGEPKRAANIAKELVNSTPTLAKLFAADPAFKRDIAVLLQEVVEAFATLDKDAPSLLGQLPPDAANAFLALIVQLDRPLPGDVGTEICIWSLFTAVLEGTQSAGGQAGLGMYLLTGTAPRVNRDLKGSTIGNGNDAQKKSLLDHALSELAGLSTINPRRAAAMLKFVAVAQNVWIWATVTVRSHGDFLQKALAWLETLQSPPRAANAAQTLISASEHSMAAHLCDILAVNLHTNLQAGDKTVLKLVTAKLGFLQQNGVSVDAYNRSLHRNLTDNLARKFPNCELADFKRSTANPAPYGRTFFYDVELAGTVLGYEGLAWHGDEDLRAQGYEQEFARANINLSLVNAQRRLLSSWKQLATTLAEFLDQDAALQPALAKTAEACLRANVEANIDEPGATKVLQTRAEMAFVLLSKLVAMKSSAAMMKELLPAAWQLIRTSPVDYDVATAEEDLKYYRTLLQILYLAIRPHCYISSSAATSREPRATDAQEGPKPTLSAATADILIEIVRKTVIPGFRALCSNLHTNLQLAQPGDFALLTGLFQTILSVQGIHVAHHQISDVAATSTIVRGCLSLYSWADHLAEIMAQDPVYGELVIHFLLTLSTVPPIAEQMALDGTLAQLSSANVSNYFRKPGGKGPWDEPARMFGIWSEGFLPLCLNLLDAVGPPIAGDVAAFLNSFPEQLGRAEDAFKTEVPDYRRNPHAGDVSLGLLREARSLVMIGLILQTDVARAAAEGVNAADIPRLEYDLGNARAEVEKLSRTQRSLADKIVATNEREAGWARQTASGSSDNVLQGLCLEEMRRTLKCFGE